MDSKLNLSAKQLENRIILKDVHTVDVDNLDPKIEQLLSKGLNFIPSSKPCSDNQILKHWDQFEKDVHRTTYFALNPAPASKSYNPKAKVTSDWHPPKTYPAAVGYLTNMKTYIQSNLQKNPVSSVNSKSNMTTTERQTLKKLKTGNGKIEIKPADKSSGPTVMSKIGMLQNVTAS